MGHVTDGGLEPEPVASIKGPGRPVNGILVLFGANFRYFPASFEMGDAGRGRDGGVWAVLKGGGRDNPDGYRHRLAKEQVWGRRAVSPRRLDSGLRRNDGVGGAEGDGLGRWDGGQKGRDDGLRCRDGG